MDRIISFAISTGAVTYDWLIVELRLTWKYMADIR